MPDISTKRTGEKGLAKQVFENWLKERGCWNDTKIIIAGSSSSPKGWGNKRRRLEVLAWTRIPQGWDLYFEGKELPSSYRHIRTQRRSSDPWGGAPDSWSCSPKRSKEAYVRVPGCFGWLSVWLLVLAQVMILGSWDWAPSQALYRW